MAKARQMDVKIDQRSACNAEIMPRLPWLIRCLAWKRELGSLSETFSEPLEIVWGRFEELSRRCGNDYVVETYPECRLNIRLNNFGWRPEPYLSGRLIRVNETTTRFEGVFLSRKSEAIVQNAWMIIMCSAFPIVFTLAVLRHPESFDTIGLAAAALLSLVAVPFAQVVKYMAWDFCREHGSKNMAKLKKRLNQAARGKGKLSVRWMD